MNPRSLLTGEARATAAIILALIALAGCGGGATGEGDHAGQDEKKSGEHATAENVTGTHPDVAPALESGEPVYFCPMHPDVVSAEQGTCDPCQGMKLIEHKGKVYGCPMHPEEVSTDIEADCRVCGMHVEELRRRKAEEAQAQTQPSS